MILEKFTTGTLLTNCYLFGNVNFHELVVIDAEIGLWEKLGSFLDKENLPKQAVKAVVATHAHFDHVRGVEKIRKETGARFVVYKSAKHKLEEKFDLRANRIVADGDRIHIGDYILKVIYTPGHSPESICLYEQDQGLLFSGDLLFRNGVGRTDLPGGDASKLKDSLEKISTLPYSTRVFPGHSSDFVLGDFPFDFHI
ncbi:MAG: MBL fold metallo-hydrolase [Patescibacteria group bacterium]|nr:MBL fold metallo-hydrolase [Patescibacteria group bacterium]